MTRVSIHTDSMGAFQARCQSCAWKSKWFERKSQGLTTEQQAVREARAHGENHEEVQP